jgi:hypothetical protein
LGLRRINEDSIKMNLKKYIPIFEVHAAMLLKMEALGFFETSVTVYEPTPLNTSVGVTLLLCAKVVKLDLHEREFPNFVFQASFRTSKAQ